MLQTFWSLAIANLVDHLEGRDLTPKIDFTSPQMRAEVVIAASPRAVFGSLVDSEAVTRWFGFPIEIEPFVGGRFAMGGLDNDPQPAKIVDLEPDRRMSLDWGGTGGKTRLTLVQSGFDSNRPPYAAWGGTIAGPLFVAVVAIQEFTRAGFGRPRFCRVRHPDTPFAAHTGSSGVQRRSGRRS